MSHVCRMCVALNVLDASSQAQARATVLVADPRLRNDRGMPDDHPYGTVETMPNVRPGDALTFYDPSTLAVLRRATVHQATRVAVGSPLVARAQACVDGTPRGNPSDVNATLPDGTRVSRVWYAFFFLRHASRSTSPQWGSIQVRSAPRTLARCTPIGAHVWRA